MSCRFLAICLALTGLAVLPVAAQRSNTNSRPTAVPVAADGHPDLSGIWTNATVTPMERPKQFSALQITDAQAAAFEQAQAQDLKDEDGKSDGPIIRAAGSSGTGGYNALFIDRGSQMIRVDGVKRSSLIIDPPTARRLPLRRERALASARC